MEVKLSWRNFFILNVLSTFAGMLKKMKTVLWNLTLHTSFFGRSKIFREKILNRIYWSLFAERDFFPLEITDQKRINWDDEQSPLLAFRNFFCSKALKLIIKNDFIQNILHWEPWWFRKLEEMSETFPCKFLLPLSLLGTWGSTQFWIFSFFPKIPNDYTKWQNSECCGLKSVVLHQKYS